MGGRVTVVGLGPGDPALRTVAGQRALDRADRIVMRTRIHPGLDDLVSDPRSVDCDDLYESSTTFGDVYAAVVDRVLDAAASHPDDEVVFAVPGHPRFGEATVLRLLAAAAAANVTVEVQPAVSALDAIAVALDVDPYNDQIQIVDALALAETLDQEPFGGGLLNVDPMRPCVIGQVHSVAVAASVKLALARYYSDDHPIVVIRAAGVPGDEQLTPCHLFELDRQRVDHLTSVWLSASQPLAGHRSPFALQRIVALLRAPGGCPWDRNQTHASLRAAVIEEAYETLDAIDADDADNLAEELGDLLLQVMLHAQIAEEAGTFAFEDVLEQVAAKLVRRHPHVFGDAVAPTPDDVVATWEAVKQAERKSAGAAPRATNAIDRLPRSMPALTRAVSILAPGKGSGPAASAGADELAVGNALLAVVERAVSSGVDPERALTTVLRNRAIDDIPKSNDGQDREGRATA